MRGLVVASMKPTRLDYVTADGHERRLMVVTRHGRWTFGDPVPATVDDVIAAVKAMGKRDRGRVLREVKEKKT